MSDEQPTTSAAGQDEIADVGGQIWNVSQVLRAKGTFDGHLETYMQLARQNMAIHRGRGDAALAYVWPATWADLAAVMTDDLAGSGGLDFAAGIIVSALCRILELEAPR